MLHHNESEWSTEKQEEVESGHRNHSIALGGLIVVLAVALGAVAYHGYNIGKNQAAQIHQLIGSQGTMTTLGQRVEVAETKLRDAAGGWQEIGQRVTKLEGRIAVSARETHKYADTMIQQLHQQITAEMDARTNPLDARLRQVESEQADQRAKMAQVEANLKQEISSVREENGRDLSGVRQQEETNTNDVTSLSHKFDQERINFELRNGQTQELIPGISLRVRGMNTGHQRYHGSLWLSQDRQTVWLRDQSAHEPVRFFQKNGAGPYELVVTNVTKKAVTGYLLAPVHPEAASAASNDHQTPVDSAANQ
jgi:hypothetical protein